MERIYLDYAATAPLDTRVLEEMMPYLTEVYGNASSQHRFGQVAQMAIDKARERVAKAIGAKPNEIYFTSGGTESDNWAIKGIAEARKSKGRHIISTPIEHHAVLHTLDWLKSHGFEITYVPVDSVGKVKLDELEKAIRPDTILITVMAANNEVGTIQPIAEIGKIAREHGVLFHTDAVQAVGSIPINVKDMQIDLLSMSAHKFYGPKGIGALYIRNGLKVDKLVVGGAQERTMRGGTYNTAAIVGMGKAIELATENLDEYAKKISEVRNYFVNKVLHEIPEVIFNGAPFEDRLPNNANFAFKYIEGEGILMTLDMAGIAVSSGSACSSGSLQSSHVLLAMGLEEVFAHGSIRFTFGRSTTKENVDYVVEILKGAVNRLRAMSPLFNQLKGDVTDV